MASDIIILVTGILGLIAAALGVRAAFVAKRATTTMHKIHILVNSKMSKALARIDQLEALLAHEDIDSPDDPNS